MNYYSRNDDNNIERVAKMLRDDTRNSEMPRNSDGTINHYDYMNWMDQEIKAGRHFDYFQWITSDRHGEPLTKRTN